MEQPKQAKPYFPGLNALRFFAASLVVLRHIPITQQSQSLPSLPIYPIFAKGVDGVNFFFVLSGFLISYLLLHEIGERKDIDLAKFYQRRILRIWPLYFLIVCFGIAFYWWLLPMMDIPYKLDLEAYEAFALYVLFLPHLVNSLTHLGGILHVTWSVGVEEQFYLFWAPLVKRFHRSLPIFILALAAFFLLLETYIIHGGLAELPVLRNFLALCQFHYMMIGAAGAYALYYHRDRFMALPIFTSQLLQAIFLGSLSVYFFLLSAEDLRPFIGWSAIKGLLFCWLIIQVSCNGKSGLHLRQKTLHWLGEISYGIYMYHMIVLYALAFVAVKFQLAEVLPLGLYHLLFYLLVFAGTILMAHISYYFVERRFLRLKRY